MVIYSLCYFIHILTENNLLVVPAEQHTVILPGQMEILFKLSYYSELEQISSPKPLSIYLIIND